MRADRSPDTKRVLVGHRGSRFGGPYAGPFLEGAGVSKDRPAGTSPTVGGYSPEKFSPPVVTDVVSRARLHPLVTAPSGAPVTVVAAAAGWGKTIFAASWLRAGNDGRKGVWVSLEETDDDPHAFWCAVATGLMPVVHARAAEALRRVAAGAVAAEELPGAVAAALGLAADPIAVVLDKPARDRLPRGASGAGATRGAGALDPVPARDHTPGSAVAAATPAPGRAGRGDPGGRPRLPRRGGSRAVHAAAGRRDRTPAAAAGGTDGGLGRRAAPGRGAPEGSARPPGRGGGVQRR